MHDDDDDEESTRDSNEQESVVEHTGDESVEDEEGANEEDIDIWKRIMSEIIGEGGRPDLMKEGGDKYDTKKLSKAIRNLAEDYVKFGNEVENSELYDEIGREKTRLENNRYGEKEAISAAWKNRKYLVKLHAITPFMKKLQSDVTSDDDGSEMDP